MFRCLHRRCSHGHSTSTDYFHSTFLLSFTHYLNDNFITISCQTTWSRNVSMCKELAGYGLAGQVNSKFRNEDWQDSRIVSSSLSLSPWMSTGLPRCVKRYRSIMKIVFTTALHIAVLHRYGSTSFFDCFLLLRCCVSCVKTCSLYDRRLHEITTLPRWWADSKKTLL